MERSERLHVSRVQLTPRNIRPSRNVVDLVMESALDRLANTARQVDVSRIDHDSQRILLDANDPVERMLLLLASSWWRARRIISSLCSRAKSPRNITPPSGKLSLMRWQPAHSSSTAPSALATHRQRPPR
jgi:hypothetical protein